MQRYVGRVSLGGVGATATIEDLEAPDWSAAVRDITGFDFQPGLVMVEILDGPSTGLVAVGELTYLEDAQVVPYREGPAFVSARTPFGPRPQG